jgi:hypothetical protein
VTGDGWSLRSGFRHAINPAVRNGLLTLVCACLALGATLLLPGSALASSPLTISNGTTTTLVGGANNCTFTANGAGQTVRASDIVACLNADHDVMVDDPSGDGGELDVDASITAADCTGASLTLEEDNGPVDVEADVSTGACELAVTASGEISVDAAVQNTDGTYPAVSLTTYPADIIEGSGGSLGASTVFASGASGITLGNTGNQIATFEATAENGTVDLVDNSLGGLTLDGAVGSTGVNITNTGAISSAAQLNSATSDASLTSTGGSVIANTGVYAAQLTVSGTSVSLTGADYVTTLIATASAGDVNADVYEPAATLGNVEATGGTVTVDNSDGALDLAGTISGHNIGLTADGFAAGGPTGLLSAPNIAITDSKTTDVWTVTANSVTAQGEPIAYTGASNLLIGGGAKIFNVTPSTSTAMSFDGGNPAAGTVNYNAQGGTVSGTTTPTSGTIDNSQFEPVAFSGMSAVNVTDAGTPLSSGGSTGTGGSSGTGSTTTTQTSPNAPTCILRASSSKISLPKRVHGKLKRKATLTLIANCTGAVHTTLNSAFTVTVKPAHKKAKSKSYGLKTIKTTLSAGASTKIVLDVPSAVVKALSTKGDKLSARFTLADSDDHDDVLMDDTVKRLS